MKVHFRFCKLVFALPLVAALTISALTQTSETRVMPVDFRSDNCTLFPDGDYCHCCVEHDKDYYFGGTEKARRASDKRLYRCVKQKNKFVAGLMYLGVRIGGVSWLPTPFRWGFGKKKHAGPVKAQ